MKIFKIFELKLSKIQLLNFYFLFMSILILSIFFYFRLLVKRAEYSLDILKNNIDIYYFFLCVVFALLHLCVLLYLIKKYFYPTKTTFLKKKFNDFVNMIVKKPLDYLLEQISPYLPYTGTAIIYYCKFFFKNYFRVYLMELLCFILFFLPKIVMSLLFFFEIIFYAQLKFFIKFLPLLLIPYIYILFLNLCEHFYKNNIGDISKGLIVTPQGIPNEFGVYVEHKLEFNKKSNYRQECFKELVECWHILFHLLNLNAITRLFIQKITPYVVMITSSAYFIALSYKIYYLFIQ